MAARVEMGEAQLAGVARSSRAGTKRSVKAGPTSRGCPGRNGLSALRPRIVPLTGDASDRRYYRILTAHDTPFVLALHATAFDVNTLPFANVARLFERMPVPIPKILGHADDIGVLALEDLGDVTLQAHLGASTSSQHSALYRQAVTLIATIQKRGAELESGDGEAGNPQRQR